MRVAAMILALTVWVHAELPKPDARGEYSGRSLHLHWQVVDPDPAGLNGRLSPDFPRDYDNVRRDWPEPQVARWPVVATFASGSRLTAKTGNVGVIRLTDPAGKTWMMVARPQGKGFCFVRCHRDFIKPVP